MRFKVTRNVDYNNEPYVDGDIIEIPDSDAVAAGQLLDCGAIVATSEKATEKPLTKMSKGELLATAAKEEVEIPEGSTNPEIAKLIATAREAAKATPQG